MIKPIKLIELEPTFVKRESNTEFWEDVPIAEADGVMFLCPKCFQAKGGRIGTHMVLCWKPSVPKEMKPGPGRWTFQGTGFADLTLNPSVNLDVNDGSPCKWHGFVRNGEVTNA